MAPFVALTGFMGSGKSSVGSRIAQLLGWRFVDLDGEIVQAEGMPIAEYFARYGEGNFRRRELEALKCVLAQSPPEDVEGSGMVLALGGGTLESPEAAALLEAMGGIVYLDVDVKPAWKRARGDSRPLASDPDAFARLLASRRPSYEHTAAWTLPVGEQTVEELAAEIAEVVTATGPAWQQSWGLRLVSTGRPSTVVGGSGVLRVLTAEAARVTADGSGVFLVTDENVERAWGQTVRESLLEAGTPTLVFATGEQSKTAVSLSRCWEWLAAQGARRDDTVIALGGGVVGDLAGFAAATYQRGIRLWQIPTSLLAQVDSSVGGKTAIDLTAGKNLAGAFYQPGLVVIDPDTLATLPDEEYANGLGEVVKYGLLAGEGLFGRMEREQDGLKGRDPVLLSDIIRSCVRYKAAVVEEDELDMGRRAVLNLGHTTAHALELTLGYGRLGHGAAVGLGLLVALAVSERLLGLDGEVRLRTRALLTGLGLPVSVELPQAGTIEGAAQRDKKVTAASAGFVGLRSVGEPAWKLTLPEGLFTEALEVIRA